MKKRSFLLSAAIVLGVIAAAILVAVLSCRSFEYPAVINMGSDHAMTGMTDMNGAGTTEERDVHTVAGEHAAGGHTVHEHTAPALSGAKSVADFVDDFGDAPLKEFTLTAEVVKRPGLPDLWTYNGSTPGPEIRVNKGDHVCVTLVNHLPDPVTIHWHGVRIANSQDGVAGLTQNAVAPGESYMYDFIAKDAGTYWYHSHQRTSDQLPRGLFGALVVEDPADPVHYDRDVAVVYHSSLDVELEGAALFGRILAQRFGAWARAETQIDGKDTQQLNVQAGDLVRVRVINAIAGEMPGTPLRLGIVGAPFQIRAIDGHDLNKPQTIEKRLVTIGMGQRYDFVFKMPASGPVVFKDPDQNELLTVSPGTASAANSANAGDLSTWPALDLMTYGEAVPGSLRDRATFDASYDLALQTVPGRRQGRVQLVHTINGEAFPYTPTLTVHEGQVIRLRFENKSGEYHPMHIHGHVFELLSIDGKPFRGSPIRSDTILIGPHQRGEVAFVADNPGLWMLHCHILIHTEFGMDMMVVYPDISTPYSIDAVNIPE